MRGVKNLLALAGVIAAITFSYAAVKYVGAYSQSIQPSSFRNFSVSGIGKVVAVPDVAEFDFGVLTEGGKNIGSLQKDNVGKVNKAIAFLKSKGVEAVDIQTQNYSVQPRYQYFNCTGLVPCRPAEIIGYTIQQNVLVKVRDFDKIGDMLAGVVENGANTVSQLNFTVDDPTKVEQEARTKAIAKAKDKAQDVAAAGGFSLGRLLSIEEGGNNQPVPMYAYGMGGGAVTDAKSVAPIVEPGSQEVSVIVTLQYEIQ